MVREREQYSGTMAETVDRKKPTIKTRFDRFKEQLKKLKAGLTTSLALSILIHIIMLILGAINFKNCPVSPNIPIFLIVYGVIGIATKLLSLGRNFLLRYFNVSPILSLALLVEVVFIICGSVWVYGAFEPKYDPAYGDEYCNRTAYLFALIVLSCIYVFLGIVLLIGICFLTCLCAIACSADSEVEVDVESTPQERAPLPAIRSA